MSNDPFPADLVRLTELDAAWAVRGAGARLDAVRRAGRRLRDRILAGGAARCVRTADVATFPYPTRYGFQGAAAAPWPYLFMRNRMHLVQVAAGGRTVTILVNPTDAVRSARAPFFARMEERYGKLATRLLSSTYPPIEEALRSWAVSPEAVD